MMMTTAAIIGNSFVFANSWCWFYGDHNRVVILLVFKVLWCNPDKQDTSNLLYSRSFNDRAHIVKILKIIIFPSGMIIFNKYYNYMHLKYLILKYWWWWKHLYLTSFWYYKSWKTPTWFCRWRKRLVYLLRAL